MRGGGGGVGSDGRGRAGGFGRNYVQIKKGGYRERERAKEKVSILQYLFSSTFSYPINSILISPITPYPLPFQTHGSKSFLSQPKLSQPILSYPKIFRPILSRPKSIPTFPILSKPVSILSRHILV